MKTWLLSIAAVLTVFLLVTTEIVTAEHVGSLRAQLSAARAQFASQERSDHAAVASLNRAYARAEQSLTAAAARIGGTHRDLITCADWQTLFLTVSGVDSFNGQISASAGPPTLPQHCINQ